MGQSSRGTETVTQNSEPWSQAQPYLRDIFQNAQSQYRQGQEYFPGSTVVPFHGDTMAGINGLRQQFSQAPMGIDQAQGTLDRVTGTNYGGANPFQSQIANAAGQTTNAGQSYINASAGANPYVNAIGAAGNRQNTAGADTLQQMASGGANPFLDQIYDRAASKVRDNTAAMFSKAGRYGSSAHADTLSENLGDMAAQMYGNAYETDANRRFGAAEALGAREAGDINRALGAAQAQAGLGESRFGRQAGAGSTLAGLQQNDYQRQLGALGMGGGLAENAFSRGMQGDQMAMQASMLYPQLNNYAQMNNRGLMEIGGMFEGQAQQQIQDQLNRWNFGQNAGWDQLDRYNRVIQPISGLGGSSSSTGPATGQGAFGSAIQGGLGGAGVGMSIGGPWGAAIGGGLGALGGLF